MGNEELPDQIKTGIKFDLIFLKETKHCLSIDHVPGAVL